MKILCLSSYFDNHLGGIEKVCYELNTRIQEKNHEVYWFASGNSNFKHLGKLNFINSRACNIFEKTLGVPFPLYSPFSLFKLISVIKKVDIVHFHSPLDIANIFAALVCFILNKKFVTTMHVYFVPYENFILNIIQKLFYHISKIILLKQSAFVIVYNEEIYKHLQKILGNKKTIFISNGVNNKIFYLDKKKSLHSKPIGIYVGRFVKKKGMDLVLEVANKLPHIQWYLIGEGAIVNENKCLENITIMSPLSQDELRLWYNNASFLLLPSRGGEGFPLVIQEALACGTTVIASHKAIEGFQSVEKVLKKTPLCVKEICKTIEKVIANKDMSKAQEQRQKFVAKYWCWDSTVLAYLELYKNAIN